MVTIEILEQSHGEEGKTSIKEVVNIEGIEPSRISPIAVKVGIPIPIADLLNLVDEIKPIEQPPQDELDDSYYARGVPVFVDGDLSPKELDLPHHIALRVVLEGIMQKYGTSDNLHVQIS